MITDKKSPYRLVTEEELARLNERETKTFMERTPKSREAFEKAHENLLDGVPMPWMADWGTDHPIFLEKAKDPDTRKVINEHLTAIEGEKK